MFIRGETLGSRKAVYELPDCNLPRKVCFCTWTARRSKMVGNVCSAGRRPQAGKRLTQHITLRRGRKMQLPVSGHWGLGVGSSIFLQEAE